MRIDRMLAIIIILLNRRSITARELSERFEVSIRTIYRDIDAIDLAGIPIVSFQGHGGGFCIMDNYKLNHQLLTLKDMGAILSTLQGVNRTLKDNALDNAIEKINSLIPREKKDELGLHLEQFVIDILPWGYTDKEKEKIITVQRAIKETRHVHFQYGNVKGERSVRTVEPMTLIFKGYTRYLFAYCLLKEDYRLFRLSRVRNLKPLEKRFVHRKASYQDYMKAGDDQKGVVNLVLQFSPKVRVQVEDWFDEEYLTVQKNGVIIARVAFPEDDWVYSTILSYGEHVEVLKPAHIRDIIRKKVQKIKEIYQT